MQTLPRGSAGLFITSLPGLLCSQHPADPNTSFPCKPGLSKPAQNTLSFASILTTFTASQSLRLPAFISLFFFFFLLTMCHTALCLHPLTCWGCADLSSSHKQEIRCGKQRFLLKIQPVKSLGEAPLCLLVLLFINKINIFCVHAHLYTALPKWYARTSEILNTANIQSKFHLLHGIFLTVRNSRPWYEVTYDSDKSPLFVVLLGVLQEKQIIYDY